MSPFHQALDLPAAAEIHDLPPPPDHLAISFADLTAADRWLHRRQYFHRTEQEIIALLLLDDRVRIHPQAQTCLGLPRRRPRLSPVS